MIEQPRYGWDDPLVYTTGIVGLVCCGLFILHELRTPEPMLPLSLFRTRNFAVGNITTLALYAGLGGMFFLVGIYVQQVSGYSATAAGATLLPVTAMMFVLSRRFGALADRLGPRVFMSVGPIIAGCGILLLVRLDANVDYVTELLPALAVFGLGLSMTVAPLTAAVLAAVDDSHSGIASGVNNAISRVAGLLAIAVLGTFVSAGFDSTVDEKLANRQLSPPAIAAVEQAKERPLAVARPANVPPQEREAIAAATTDASVEALHVGMAACAAFTILGGLAAFGIVNPRKAVGAARCPGGHFAGAPEQAARDPVPVS